MLIEFENGLLFFLYLLSNLILYCYFLDILAIKELQFCFVLNYRRFTAKIKFLSQHFFDHFITQILFEFYVLAVSPTQPAENIYRFFILVHSIGRQK